jgi:hypothetical protein
MRKGKGVSATLIRDAFQAQEACRDDRQIKPISRVARSLGIREKEWSQWTL